MMADALTRVLFRKLVSMSGDDYENGEVVIDRGRIVDMRSGISESFSGVTHDKSDCLVLPGFVNAHCHLSLSGLKGKVPRPDRFIDWIESVVTENAALSWADRVSAMHTEAQTLIESGVTALADYFSHPELLVEYQNLPFHQVLFLETLGFQKEGAESKARELATLLQEHPGTGSKMQLALAPHAPYSVSPALFRELKKLAERMGCRFSCHVAEVAEETRFLRDGKGEFLELLNQRKVYDRSWTPPGVSPVRYLEQLGVLRELVAIHLNYMDEEDLDRLAARMDELADMFGRRRIFFVGAAIFAIFSVIGGFAPDIWLLLAARFTMGIGGALMWPAILGMTFALLPANKAGLAGGLVLGAAVRALRAV